VFGNRNGKNEGPEQNQMGQLTKTRQHLIVVACSRQAPQIFMHCMGPSRRTGEIRQPKHEHGKFAKDMPLEGTSK